MIKRLITVILCFFALIGSAQIHVTENPWSDSTRTSHHLFNPNSGTIISGRNYLRNYAQAKTMNPGDSVHNPWPATWAEFKKAFLDLDIEDPLANLDLHLPSPKEMRNFAYPQGGIVMEGPISMLYNQFSKEARSKRILAGLVKKDEAAVRYNPVLITKLTGIKDEGEIKKFIDFCALRVQFILEASDYELYAAILECYESYCLNEPDSVAPGD
jgi:hypothetical protein